MLRSLLYVSSAVRILDQSELLDLLQVSRNCNELAGITGLVVYEEGNFIQVLEGPSEAVEETMRRIRNDVRHHMILVLLDNEISERLFGSWAMAFATVDELTDNGLDNFVAHNPHLQKLPRCHQVFRLLLNYRSMFRR